MHGFDEPRGTSGVVGESGPIGESDADRLRPGLQHLFGVRNGGLGDRNRGPNPEEAGLEVDLGPSAYLQAYEADGHWGVLPTGVQPLDDMLGGGVGRGVTVVGGDPGSGKTLLLEEAARAALVGGWSVYYAAYREGTLRVWERLMARASLDDGGLALTLSTLGGRSLDRSSYERLQALDARFRSWTAQRMVLVDRLPAGRDALRALFDGIWWRRREARQAGRPGPLVVIDDLQTLERQLAETGDRWAATGVRGSSTAAERLTALGDLAGRLDTELLQLGLPGLIAAAPSIAGPADGGWGTGSLEPGLRGSTFVRMTCGVFEGGTQVPLEVAIEKNGRTGWIGRLHLTLDRRVGRFVVP